MNGNQLVKEICRREKGVGKGLNAAQVKTILRHLGDIALVDLAKIQKTTPDLVALSTAKTSMGSLLRSARTRARKASR